MFDNSMIVPFLLLLILCVYLIYTRSAHEQEVYESYDRKFEEWKKNSQNNIVSAKQPKFVGIIFEDEEKVVFEVFDKSSKEKIENQNFEIRMKNL